jgi:pre-60S factor REI1
MERVHGMFIPEKQYLVNLEGLLTALQQRVFALHECISCGKVKSNVFAAQTHMRDKGHCSIPYTTEEEQLEIGDFYDFRSTYSDEASDDESTDDASRVGGAKLGANRPGEDGHKVTDDDDGWETDSSASSLDSEYLTAVPAEQHYHQYERLDKHPHHARDDPRNHHQRDGWHSHAHKHTHAVFYDEYEMHLPSGKSIGHRSLNKYYRQNLYNYPTPEERAGQLLIENMDAENIRGVSGDGESRLQFVGREQLLRRNRAILGRQDGGPGMSGVAAGKKNEVRKAEHRGRTLENFSSRKNEWSVNKGANYQKYYHYSIL